MSQIKALQNKKAVQILGERWSTNQRWDGYSLFQFSWEVREVDGAYFFSFVEDPTPISAQFQDLTGWECFHNKVHIEDYFPDGCSPLDCFHASLETMTIIARSLQEKFPNVEFQLFTSFDGNYAVLNFHKMRPGEKYLVDDLDSYDSEAIVVLNVK